MRFAGALLFYFPIFGGSMLFDHALNKYYQITPIHKSLGISVITGIDGYLDNCFKFKGSADVQDHFKTFKDDR